MARITKKYLVTLRIKDDHADSVDESVLSTLLTSALEDEDIDTLIEVDPENSVD